MALQASKYETPFKGYDNDKLHTPAIIAFDENVIITCPNCRKDFEISYDSYNAREIRCCPHCDIEIDVNPKLTNDDEKQPIYSL